MRIPPPTGPARVGTLALDLDTGRPEPMTAAPDDRRRIVVQLWYPAAAGDCRPADYMNAATSRAVAEDLPPDFGLRVRHDACRDAAPAPGGRWPVVLYSHGLGATRFSTSALLEELASRGYLAVAIHHTYGSTFTAFVNGDGVPWDESRWESDGAFESNLAEWVADARSVLGLLAELDHRPAFALAGRIALDRVGYAGHSFGGTVAVAARASEPRVAAVVNLDGRLLPSVPRPVRLDVPLLALLNARSPSVADYAPAPDLYLGRIAGTGHVSFTDLPILMRAFAPALAAEAKAAGAIAPEAAIALTRELVTGFLDCTLRAEPIRCADVRRVLAAAAAP